MDYRVGIVFGLICCVGLRVDAEGLSGDAVIRSGTGKSEIVITTTSRLAGAVHSLKWNGKEFIDSADHGRQLQSASNLDCAQPIIAETFNPTEAGSVNDGAGPTSTSRLLHQVVGPDYLQTTTQMAFWLAPGGESLGHPARNTTLLSNHLLTKRIQIGQPSYPQAISYDVTFHVPVGELHHHAVFEVLTGYMPTEFSEFLLFDSSTKSLRPLSDGPGEQSHPVVLATSNGQFAMGCLAIEAQIPGGSGPTYGRFRFPSAQVVKWNCVYRYTNHAGFPPGDYPFRLLVFVGSTRDVESMLQHFSKK